MLLAPAHIKGILPFRCCGGGEFEWAGKCQRRGELSRSDPRRSSDPRLGWFLPGGVSPAAPQPPLSSRVSFQRCFILKSARSEVVACPLLAAFFSFATQGKKKKNKNLFCSASAFKLHNTAHTYFLFFFFFLENYKRWLSTFNIMMLCPWKFYLLVKLQFSSRFIAISANVWQPFWHPALPHKQDAKYNFM